ncbi:hypothetical protein F5051DRAFT_382948 [Lentinula edodes]|nr:hypothetical protein F5051DRAFT_382948 [Lentinula edodes]
MSHRDGSEASCRKCNQRSDRVSVDTMKSLRESLRCEDAVSSARASEVSSVLVNLEKDIEDCSVEIARLQAQIRSQNTKRDFLHHVKQWGQSILAPVRRLPNEILHEIFAYCMLDDTFTVAKDFGMSRQPAWVLSSICSKWRKIALSCKPLWSNICLDFKASHESSQHAFHALSRLLDQSYPHTVDVSIIGFSNAHSRLWDCLALHAHRWKHAEFEDVNGLFQDPMWSTLRLPALESLTLNEYGRDLPLDLEAFRHAPLLRKADLRGVLPDSLLLFPWCQLTHLELNRFKVPVFPALSACTNLEGLKITVHHAQVLSSPSSVLHSVVPFVELYKLKTLHITLFGTSNRARIHSLADIFKAFITPSLNSLQLCCQYLSKHFQGCWPQSSFESFLERSQCSIRTLVLNQTTFSPSEVQKIFSSLRTVTALTIKDASFVCLTAVSPTISQLSAGGSLFKTGAVLLPNLQDLIIHSRCRRNLPSSAAAPSSILDDTVLAEMVKSRWIPDTTYASVFNIRCLRSVSIQYFAPGRIMNNSSRTMLEFLRADGLKFVVQVNPNEVEVTSDSETDESSDGLE